MRTIRLQRAFSSPVLLPPSPQANILCFCPYFLPGCAFLSLSRRLPFPVQLIPNELLFMPTASYASGYATLRLVTVALMISQFVFFLSWLHAHEHGPLFAYVVLYAALRFSCSEDFKAPLKEGDEPDELETRFRESAHRSSCIPTCARLNRCSGIRSIPAPRVDAPQRTSIAC